MAGRHLLFITTDHQRADSLDMVQCGREVTPFLNGLAGGSVRFGRAYTACPLCRPARTALATGRRPSATGVTTNFGFPRPARVPALHDLLSEAGYTLMHAGKQHISLEPDLRERVDFAAFLGPQDHRDACQAQGIDFPDYCRRPGFKAPVTEPIGGQPSPRVYSSVGTEAWPFAQALFLDIFWRDRLVRALRALPASPDRPLAVFLNLWCPHPPLFCPEPWFSRFDPERIELPAHIGVPAEGEPADRRSGPAAQLAQGVDEAQWRRVWSAHLGLVSMADELAGSVVRLFRERGWWDDTLTVFTTDHGDHLGEHAMYQKMECYESAVRIPLLVHGAGIPAARVTTPVSHLDVLPTLTRLLGLRHPDPGALEGEDLLGLGTEDREVAIEYNGNWGPGLLRRCILNRREKLILDGSGETEYFDLEDDPRERVNRSRDPRCAAAVERLTARLLERCPEARSF
jgi:arylsulfatase A-like enzyme